MVLVEIDHDYHEGYSECACDESHGELGGIPVVFISNLHSEQDEGPDGPKEPDNGDDECIYDEEHEGLPVLEPYAIIEPGAVVIHDQDTSLAGGAVVSTFWFEYLAD